jgi:exodeoxyribonuclease VII small subunit
MSNKKTFEEAMEELEQIVNQLEKGDVPLEEALSIFQKGIELSQLCNKKLKHVEEQLAKVLTEDGTLKDFTVDEEDQE